MWQKIKCWLGLKRKSYCSFYKDRIECKAYKSDIRSCKICPLNIVER